MWQGFVTVGRGELLLTLLAVALLMFVVGIAAGQIYLMARRPAVVKSEPCSRLHCETPEELNAWLRRCDYSLITNEVLATVDFSKPRGRHAMADTAERRTFERRRHAPSPLQHWSDEERPDIFGQGDDPEWAAWNAPSPADTQSTDRWPTEEPK